jgi:hypothetical protein
MVKSIANQEAIERFIRKVDEARKQLNTEENPTPTTCPHFTIRALPYS